MKEERVKALQKYREDVKNGNIKNTHSDYIAINLSKVVSKIIQSYVGYINKKVWLK